MPAELRASFIVEKNCPIPLVTVNNTLPIDVNTLAKGVKALITVDTTFLPIFNTENKPLNVFFNF